MPTLKVSTESCENLAEMEICVLRILEAASSDSTAKAIFEKIDFRVMDSTSHNFHVDEKVSDHLDSAHVPKELICHVHPVFRMVRDMIKTLCAV